MQFKVGDKVRCTISEHQARNAVTTKIWGKVGEVVSLDGDVKVKFPLEGGDSIPQWVSPYDLQYQFQEGDIVRLICHCHNSLPTGVIAAPPSWSSGDVIYVHLDGSPLDPLSCEYKNLELIDRAPKSDAEQCCNAESDIQDFLNVRFEPGNRVIVTEPTFRTGMLGTVLNLVDFCGVPHVSVATEDGVTGLYEYDEIELCPEIGYDFAPTSPCDAPTFPVDEPCEKEEVKDFVITLTDGTQRRIPEHELEKFTVYTDGRVEVQTTTGDIAGYTAASYTRYVGPTIKCWRMVDFRKAV